MNSTLTHNLDNAVLINEYSSASIIEMYKKQLDINVERFFKNIETVQLFECKTTKYQYYYPKEIAGDSDFYEQLEQFNWYYMSWKWEHETVLELIQKDDAILEVGSGGLGFIEKINAKGYEIVGLELNDKSIIKAKEKGLKVLSETIQDFALKNRNAFDMVCSFQVLEHISDVDSFLRAKIDCLKPGGKLVICVPNNNSFIKYTEGGVLNFPPHHMGRWTKQSLENITEQYQDIKLIDIVNEPLQTYHFNWYINQVTNKIKSTYKLYRPYKLTVLIKKLVSLYVKYNHKNIKGHSIMAIYEKTS